MTLCPVTSSGHISIGMSVNRDHLLRIQNSLQYTLNVCASVEQVLAWFSSYQIEKRMSDHAR